MRKFQKQQILDAIQSLHMLHREIKDSLEGKEYKTAQAALADCQEAAIQIGEVIEQIEGIGTQDIDCHSFHIFFWGTYRGQERG